MEAGQRRALAILIAATLLGGAPAAQASEPRKLAQYGSPMPAPQPSQRGQVIGPRRPETIQMVQPGDNDEEACRRRWQEYERSQACFAPFRTVSGMKQEAFVACGKELPDPSADCGPPKPQ
jgi:hypothetical protein